MSSSSGVGNGRGIVCCRGGHDGCGGLGGSVWEDTLPRRPELHFHREITLQMGDPTCVANVVI
jgi:hypothetical protein